MIVMLIGICLVAALVLAPAHADAQNLRGWLQKSFLAEQVDADRIRLTSEVEIEGEPGSPNAGQKFFADELQMNTKTGELIAIGNVVFQTPEARISADSVTFNTKTQQGAFKNASGIAQLGERGERNRSMFGTLEPDVYFWAETLEKFGRDKYRIRKGGFTTCVQPTPRWQIVSDTATLDLHDYVIMRNAVVQVKDVPVFYMPLLYYPIRDDDRSTGLLLPLYGTSLATGNSISNAFFWAINRSHDATFFHDWMFSRGQGLGVEYRYLMGPRAQADLRYYWLDEKETLINGLTRQPRRSTSVRGGLSQNLPFGLSARARVDYFSDVTVQQTYSHDFASASQSVRTAQGGISGSWGNLSVNGTYNRTEYFYGVNYSTLSGQTPGLSALLSGVKLAGLPVFATLTAETAQSVYVTRSGTTVQDLTLRKTEVVPSLRAPLSTLPFLQVNATASYRRTSFSESLAADLRTQIEEPITRAYSDLGVAVVGPVFSRVFNPNNAVADRLKHVIEPSFSISKRSEIANQSRIPSVSATDITVGGVTQMTYGLTNRLLVRKERAGEPAASAPREFLSVSIRQSYYTDKTASQFDNSYSYGYYYRAANALSPVSLAVRATPTAPMSFDYRVEYDPVALPDGPKFLGMSANAQFRTPNVDVSGGWNRTAFSFGSYINSNNFIQGQADLKLKQSRFGGVVGLNYDIGRQTLITQRYVGFYNAQCCGISFEYQSINYPNNGYFLIPQDRRFNMSFTLAGVGSFSNFFGAFGVGTGARR